MAANITFTDYRTTEGYICDNHMLPRGAGIDKKGKSTWLPIMF